MSYFRQSHPVASCDVRGILAGSTSQTSLQREHVGRQDEYRDRVGAVALDLPCSLVIDVEDDTPLTPGSIQLTSAGSVQIGVNLGPFEELTLLDERDELIVAHEVIFPSILFGGTGTASRV